MEAKKLVELRKQAERAVADMADGEMKVKAFEVVLSHLLAGSEPSRAAAHPAGEEPQATGGAREEKKATKTLGGRVLVLRDEGFFNSLRAMADIREELKAHGWNYPLSKLSGALQTLAQKRELRRQLQTSTHGKKKVYKYSNR